METNNGLNFCLWQATTQCVCDQGLMDDSRQPPQRYKLANTPSNEQDSSN